ncbi:MAG: hypothetical protein HFG71_01695 [Hungatella sp.]|jgi:DNA repair exonuclease SbcCD ATPase subunit|nr:hypothetical protein [Hungatella sp.]
MNRDIEEIREQLNQHQTGCDRKLSDLIDLSKQIMEELIAFEQRIQIYSKKLDAVENRIKDLINIETPVYNF